MTSSTHEPHQPGPPRRPQHRRKVAIAVAGIVSIAVFTALGVRVVTATAPGSAAPGVVTSGLAPSAGASTSTERLDRRTAQPVHDALHDIAARCPTETGPTPGTIRAGDLTADDLRRLTQDAALIVAFARRHPHAQFPIDDEQGTTLSLLMVTREALAPCAPAAAASADELLPAEYRTR